MRNGSLSATPREWGHRAKTQRSSYGKSERSASLAWVSFISTLRSCGQKTCLARGVAKSCSLRTELWSNANRDGTRAHAHGRRRPESAQRQMLTSNRKLTTTSSSSTTTLPARILVLAVRSPRSGAKQLNSTTSTSDATSTSTSTNICSNANTT